MSDVRLNPEKLGGAIETLETIFGPKCLEKIEERAIMVKNSADSSYKEDLIKCEKVNEANYNTTLPLVRGVRDVLGEIKEVAEYLAKRTLETTKQREAEGTIEQMDAVSALRG